MIQKSQFPLMSKVFGSVGRVKILELLSINDELNITAISRITSLNHSRTKVHLESLIEMELVQEKRFGRIV